MLAFGGIFGGVIFLTFAKEVCVYECVVSDPESSDPKICMFTHTVLLSLEGTRCKYLVLTHLSFVPARSCLSKLKNRLLVLAEAHILRICALPRAQISQVGARGSTHVVFLCTHCFLVLAERNLSVICAFSAQTINFCAPRSKNDRSIYMRIRAHTRTQLHTHAHFLVRYT